MDAVKYIKAMDGLCKSHPSCSKCPLFRRNNKTDLMCDEYITTYTEEVVAIAEKWLIDHPAKTMADDFFEKYPNAPRDETYPNIPRFCPMALGFPSPIKGCVETDCAECWGREAE